VSTATPPQDWAVRQAAVHTLDQSIALEAGAGAGKTTVLVERVLGALLSGLPPARVAAITFTERAAGELQVRVRDKLELRYRSARGQEREPLARLVEEISDLRTSTIHAFCKELLAREALEAAWAPDTTIVTGSSALWSTSEVFARWRAALRQADPAYDDEVRSHVSDQAIQKAAEILLMAGDVAPIISAPPDWPAHWEALQALAPDLRGHISADCLAPDRCALYPQVVPLLGWLDDAEQAGPAGVQRAAGAVPRFNLNVGRGGDWRRGACASLKAKLKVLREWQEACAKAGAAAINAHLVRAVHQDLLPALAAERCRLAMANFDDLLRRAYGLLNDNPGARARLAASFDAILIDEVQDTDPIQSRVAMLLSRGAALDGPWDSHPPLPGRLFAVGDPKQSIYRFRRADVTMWQQLGSALSAGGGQQLSLSENFRSVPGLVAWCNHTFAQMPQFAPQVAHRQPAALPPVVWLQVEAGESDLDGLVRYLWQLRRSEVPLGSPGQERPLRWSDVLVLLPSWIYANDIEDALLSAGIPALVEGGTSFAARDEVRLSLAALRALDEPGDGDAVVHVLRGLFGCSHAQLAEHRAAGGSWRYTGKAVGHPVVVAALQVLWSVHYHRGRRSWTALLDELLEQSGVLAVWALQARGAAMLGNLEKLRALIRQCETEHVCPARALQEVVTVLRQDEEADLPLADAESDTVRITSYFKAKGREAGVVVLMRPKRRQFPPPFIVDRAQGRIAVAFGTRRPAEWEALQERDKEEEAQERRRWLYVAATRACDQLVVVHHPDFVQLYEPDVLRGLPTVFGAHGDRCAVAPGVEVLAQQHLELPEVDYQQSAFPGLDDAVAAALDAFAVAPPPLEVDRQEHSDTAALRASVRACARWDTVSAQVGRWRPGPGSTQRTGAGIGKVGGALVHAVLERLDLRQPAPALLAAAHAAFERLLSSYPLDEGAHAACRHVLERLLAHEVFAQARQAPEIWQETPFCVLRKGTHVTGCIDLCFPRDAARQEWVVADYKTALLAPRTEAMARCERQLELYAQALEQLMPGCSVVARLLITPSSLGIDLPAAPALAAAPADNDALLHNASPELRAPLRRLLDAGFAPPVVGFEFCDSAEIDFIAELAWPEGRLALVIDLRPAEQAWLEGQGWRVWTDDAELCQAEAILAEIQALLADHAALDDATTPHVAESDALPTPTHGPNDRS